MMDLDERLTRKKKDDLDAKEKTYRLVGDSGWRQANEGMSVKVAKKYAAGGITDGTEVRWAKKADLPPELAAALGMFVFINLNIHFYYYYYNCLDINYL